MEINTTLRDILITGKLGPVGVGTSRANVQTYFGEPDDWAIPKKETSSIWKYGALELFFGDANPNVLGFQLEIDHYNQLPPFIHIVGYYPSLTTTLDEFGRFLRHESLPYALSKPFENDLITLAIGEKSSAYFDIEKNRLEVFAISDRQSQEKIVRRDQPSELRRHMLRVLADAGETFLPEAVTLLQAVLPEESPEALLQILEPSLTFLWEKHFIAVCWEQIVKGGLHWSLVPNESVLELLTLDKIVEWDASISRWNWNRSYSGPQMLSLLITTRGLQCVQSLAARA